MDDDDCHVFFHIIPIFRFMYLLFPKSSGFLTLGFSLQICLRRVIHVGKHVPASDLASSGAMWLPCGALKAWVIFVGSRCWLLVAG